MKRLLLGTFCCEEDLLGATRAARESGLQIVDVFTPYAVHGLDEAMGLPPSRLGRACFGFGVLGVVLAFALQYWTSAFDWPINVGGRPWNSWPAFVPVAFEVMVLLASFGVVFAFLGVSRLFPGRRELLPASGVTGDRFVLMLEETNAAFDVGRVQEMFRGFHVLETVERDQTLPSKASGDSWLAGRTLNIVLLVMLIVVLVLNFALSNDPGQPNVEFLPDMAHAVSYGTFVANPNFADGRTLQSPVAGSIPRGHMPLHVGSSSEEAVRAGKELKSPVSSDDKNAKRLGPILYSNHCQVCHGAQGKGDGPVTLRGVPPPPSLLAAKTIDMPDGQLFHVLAFGQGNMASYATHLTAEERWFVIDHIRGMQKQAGGK